MTTQQTTQNPRSADQLRNEIRQTITDATNAARDAARDGAQGSGRNVVIPPVPPLPPIGPGFTIENGGPRGDDMPPGVKDVAIGFFIMVAVIVIGWPIARAFGRRIERRAVEPTALPAQLGDQLQRIEQAVDAMSIEIERISESQRFMAKLQNQSAERVPLPSDRG